MKLDLKYFVLFTLLITSALSIAQDLLDFDRVLEGIYQQYETRDTISSNEKSIVIDYRSKNKTDYCQQTIFSNGSQTIFGFNPENLTSYYYVTDSLNRISSYSSKTDIKLVAYHFYPSGKLSSYSITIEDTANNRANFANFRYTSNSFKFEYYEDGSTKSRLYYIPGCQEHIIYWPNGKNKIIAEYNANRFSYCGKYREFDDQGNLIVKGTYHLPEDPLLTPVKIGVWKYFESGKLVKKEQHKI